MRKRQLSQKKRVKIATSNFLHKNEHGKYFPIKSKNISNNIPLIRTALLPEYFAVFFDQITQDSTWHKTLLSGKLKRSVKELDSPFLFSSDVDTEYFWAKFIIALNDGLLNEFVKSSAEYSKLLLQGDYSQCSEILESIEEKYGQSIWLIKNKIAFLQLTQGLEAQKKYTQKIKNDLKNGGLTRFIIHWISVRNEPQTTIGRFSSQIETIVKNSDPNTQAGFQEYCNYHLLGVYPNDLEGFGQILRLSYSTSMIDYYEAFILLLKAFSSDESSKYDSRIKNILRTTPSLVSDPRLSLVKAIIGNIDGSALASDGIEPYTLFLQGEYQRAIEVATEILEKEPANLLSIVAKANSEAMLVTDDGVLNVLESQDAYSTNLPMSATVTQGVRKIFCYGIEGAPEEFNQICKIALNFSSFSWTTVIDICLGQEKYFLDKNDDTFGILLHKDSSLNPTILDKINNKQLIDTYANLCSLAYRNNTTLSYHHKIVFNDVSNFPQEISDVHKELALAEICFNKAEFDLSISSSESLKKAQSGFFSRRGFGIQALSFLKQGDLYMACKTVADCYIHNRSSHPYLPLQELSELIKPGTDNWNSINSKIELSIIFDACVKHLDKSFETARRFAYEDFLEKRGIDKPSELINFLDKEDKEKLIYYLQFICLESTMDMSGAFEGGSSEVLSERLLVCRLLVEIDPHNEETYKSEINELVRRQVILDRRKEVDQSRIYVDIDSVKELSYSELSEIFARYQAYLRHGVNSLNNGEKSFDNLLAESLGKSSKAQITVPTNEVLALLSFMIETVSRWYLSSEIGLDRFISTRIRHGELERTMRIPLQNHNLITKKQIKTGPYLSNFYWLEKFDDYPEAKVDDLDKAFVKFSEDYDNLITVIANEWLQIVKPNKPNGLFDFTLFDSDYEWIYKSTDQNTSFKTFINYVITLLEEKLIYTLVAIRERINTVARNEAKTLMNNLQEATHGLYGPPCVELQSSISQARTDLQAQFNKIIEWFVPSSTGNSAPYQIEDAIWVAEAGFKEENPSFTISVDAEESDLSIHGQLPIFVDIFINIFENVVKRSGLEQPVANVKIWTISDSEEMSTVFCNVTNELGPEIDIYALDLELKKKKEALDSGDYVKHLATERNSGLYKIYKSVRDFNVAGSPIFPTIDFGVKDNRFFILISVPLKIFKLEEVEEI